MRQRVSGQRNISTVQNFTLENINISHSQGGNNSLLLQEDSIKIYIQGGFRLSRLKHFPLTPTSLFFLVGNGKLCNGLKKVHSMS